MHKGFSYLYIIGVGTEGAKPRPPPLFCKVKTFFCLSRFLISVAPPPPTLNFLSTPLYMTAFTFSVSHENLV